MIEDLKGLTLTAVLRSKDEEISFHVDDGQVMVMRHNQDCCEGVRIEEVHGDLADLVGSPILQAECVTSNDLHPDTAAMLLMPNKGDESWTWTFYKLATLHGHVTIRWYGQSNGYYSEGVDCHWEAGA